MAKMIKGKREKKMTLVEELVAACKFALSVQTNNHGLFDLSDRMNADKLTAAIKRAEDESVAPAPLTQSR